MKQAIFLKKKIYPYLTLPLTAIGLFGHTPLLMQNRHTLKVQKERFLKIMCSQPLSYACFEIKILPNLGLRRLLIIFPSPFQRVNFSPWNPHSLTPILARKSEMLHFRKYQTFCAPVNLFNVVFSRKFLLWVGNFSRKFLWRVGNFAKNLCFVSVYRCCLCGWYVDWTLWAFSGWLLSYANR